MPDDDEHSTHPSPPPSHPDDEHPETQPIGAPSSMLPSPYSDDAPAIELHVPPNATLPSIREVPTLTPAESDYKPAATNGDILAGVRQLVEHGNRVNCERIDRHEREEERIAAEAKAEAKRVADELAAKVETVDRLAREERQALATQVADLKDAITDGFVGLRENFADAARSIADPFLAKVQEWITDLQNVKDTQQRHEVRMSDLEKMRGVLADVRQLVMGIDDRLSALERALVSDGR